MFRATKDIILPTTITGSLPRPSWYTENLGTRHFLEAMVSRRFREQYEDALTCFIRDQELAGLDIVTDGDCRFDDRDVSTELHAAYYDDNGVRNERLAFIFEDALVLTPPQPPGD